MLSRIYLAFLYLTDHFLILKLMDPNIKSKPGFTIIIIDTLLLLQKVEK